jgi:hydrogenase maturation protein HypF
MAKKRTAARLLRRTFTVTGQVQGVGFRPFVYRLATRLGLSGTVLNHPGGVDIVAIGPAAALDEFDLALECEAPPLAAIDEIILTSERQGKHDGAGFQILTSGEGAGTGRVTVDTACCPDCVAELFDPMDRRHRHGLVNCTGCGPRYTIATGLPWDRPNTTMADFPLCAECTREYTDPTDRRFHAQPVCCPACGPVVRLTLPSGEAVPGDPCREAARLLKAGSLIAMKGLGGFHLAVDARNEVAVARLRRAKARDRKPFALLVRDLAAARALVRLSPAGEDLLQSPAAPIVLADRREGGVARSVAFDSHRLGLMLPNTPLQHLLAHDFRGPLVMTSLNRTDDPLVADDAEAAAFGDSTDAYLSHDRHIERAVDDSVFADTPRQPVPVRRARGFVPAPIRLPIPVREPLLAMGGDLKSVVAVVRGDQAVLSQPFGDLDHPEAYRRFRSGIDDLLELLDVAPRRLVADLHPDYRSRRFAEELARELQIPLDLVPHHHAHLASLLAEHGRTEPAVGLTLDGVGYGEDGAAWGGEVLVGDLREFFRAGHLRPLRLPGGDAAAVETSRCGFSWLTDLLGAEAVDHPLAAVAIPDPERRSDIASILAADLRCPPSTGAGRLFDAAASLLGLCRRNSFEAESGMALESAAFRSVNRPSGEGLMPLGKGVPFQLDHRPLLQRIIELVAAGTDVADLAFLFHDALADGLALAARRVARATGNPDVALTGGVFLNGVLTELLVSRLELAGLSPLTHRVVPPGDGGIALGQAAVVAARTAGKA